MMIVNDEKNQKICSFYVSDYHLEMMLVPYINKKIENNENVTIETEKDLKETIVIASHDLDMILDVCDRVLVLNNGEIIQEG